MDHWPISRETTVANRDKFNLKSKWAAAEARIGLPAQHNVNSFANDSRMQFPRDRTIHHRTETGIAHTRFEQCTQKISGIAVAAGSGIIRIVGNYQRPFVGLVGNCNCRSLVNAEIVVQHFVAPVPNVVRYYLGESSVCCEISLTGHQHRGTNLGNVCTGETCIDADGEYVRLVLIGPRRGNAIDHRADVGASTIDFFQHGPAHADRARFNLASHRPVQDLASLATGVAHIDMRISFERNNDVSESAHLTADICMWIERDGNRHILTHHAADASKQLTFAIFKAIDVHRTMQPEEKSVERVLPDGGKDRITEPVKRCPPDFATWTCSSAEHVIHTPAMICQRRGIRQVPYSPGHALRSLLRLSGDNGAGRPVRQSPED